MLLSYGWASQPPAKAEFPLGIPFALLGIITAGGAAMRYVYILRSNSCPWRHYVGVMSIPVQTDH
jgi:hypothetical protein